MEPVPLNIFVSPKLVKKRMADEQKGREREKEQRKTGGKKEKKNIQHQGFASRHRPNY